MQDNEEQDPQPSPADCRHAQNHAISNASGASTAGILSWAPCNDPVMPAYQNHTLSSSYNIKELIHSPAPHGEMHCWSPYVSCCRNPLQISCIPYCRWESHPRLGMWKLFWEIDDLQDTNPSGAIECPSGLCLDKCTTSPATDVLQICPQSISRCFHEHLPFVFHIVQNPVSQYPLPPSLNHLPLCLLNAGMTFLLLHNRDMVDRHVPCTTPSLPASAKPTENEFLPIAQPYEKEVVGAYPYNMKCSIEVFPGSRHIAMSLPSHCMKNSCWMSDLLTASMCQSSSGDDCTSHTYNHFVTVK